jgi:hypothetical protein
MEPSFCATLRVIIVLYEDQSTPSAPVIAIMPVNEHQ